VPPLFYTAVLIAYVTHSVNVWTVLLAWAYVGLRIVHTVVHLGSNDVASRSASARASVPAEVLTQRHPSGLADVPSWGVAPATFSPTELCR
jgi:hypothetical protein